MCRRACAGRAIVDSRLRPDVITAAPPVGFDLFCRGGARSHPQHVDDVAAHGVVEFHVPDCDQEVQHHDGHVAGASALQRCCLHPQVISPRLSARLHRGSPNPSRSSLDRGDLAANSLLPSDIWSQLGCPFSQLPRREGSATRRTDPQEAAKSLDGERTTRRLQCWHDQTNRLRILWLEVRATRPVARTRRDSSPWQRYSVTSESVPMGRRAGAGLDPTLPTHTKQKVAQRLLTREISLRSRPSTASSSLGAGVEP